jgi:hypothetical protein
MPDRANWNNVVAMSCGAAAVIAAFAMAGPIAVGIVGTQSLTGAAATFKALATLGAGSIAAGGTGMLGGKILIMVVAAAAGVRVCTVYETAAPLTSSKPASPPSETPSTPPVRTRTLQEGLC